MKKTFSLFISAIFFTVLISFYLHSFNNGNKTDESITLKDIEQNKSLEKDPGFVPADDWFGRQRAFPFDEIPNEEYLKSIKHVKNSMERRQYDNSSVISEWQLAGPKNIEGRVTAVVIHPYNPNLVYIGTANGGVWKSNDFCQSWESVFNDQNTYSIGALAIDPLEPEIIYCGTGEANSLRSYYPGTGIYKSVNGGSDWTHIGLDSSYCIGNIAINPSNTNEVFVAAGGWTRRKNPERGIYKTSDGGSSWNKVLYIADSVGAIDVIIHPSDNSKIFAAMWERQRREDYVKYGGSKSGMYVSTNSGDYWTQIRGGFPANDSTLGRISIDISVNFPDIMYALVSETYGGTKGLYRSVNGGNNWINVNSTAAQSGNYAWFNRICKVNPVDPTIVYCGGIDMNTSTNSGATYSVIGSFHPDQHAIAFSPSNPNYIVVGNDGGIEYSTDGGITFNSSTTLPITQFYAGEIDFNNPNTILGGTQDNGTIRTTGDSFVWNTIHGGDGFYCIVDYTNPQIIYASSQNGFVARSTNGGISFGGSVTGLDRQYTNWMTPYVMDKNNPQTLYIGTYKIFKTANGMQTWTAISPDLANEHRIYLGTITTVDVSKSDPDVIYCGTDDANVWVTKNGGTNWTKINSGLPYRWVTRVAIHPDSANVCYVTLSGYKVDSTGSHIFRTTNYGKKWTSIRGNLPDAPINDVIIDPSNTNTLIIATDISVMFSTNLGSRWNILSSGIPPNIPCMDLTLHNPTRTLVVWTHGRSSYKMNLSGLTNTENSVVPVSDYKLSQNYPNPFNPSTKISYELRSAGYVSVIVFDLLGNEVESLVNKKLSQGAYEVEWNGANNSSGVYFYQLTVNGNPLDTKKMLLLK